MASWQLCGWLAGTTCHVVYEEQAAQTCQLQGPTSAVCSLKGVTFTQVLQTRFARVADQLVRNILRGGR